jgi:magnesium transporter
MIDRLPDDAGRTTFTLALRAAFNRAWKSEAKRSDVAANASKLPRSDEGLPGAAPGLEPADLVHPTGAVSAPTVVTCLDYCVDRFESQSVGNSSVDDISEFLARHRPEWSQVRWINVNGITNLAVIRALAEKYHLHPLAVEDVVQAPQRPKVEDYPQSTETHPRLFVIVRMLAMIDGRLLSEQASFFLGRKTLLTFQESALGDVWNPVRQRIATSGTRLRQNDASFLLYSLLDAIVDQCFPILEVHSNQLEDLEDQVLNDPHQRIMEQIHSVKRELILLRRAAWPMREVINNLQREPHLCMSDETRTYLRDVYDHSVQIIDLVETYREFANGLTETYMSALSIRMNEIMKVLTIMGTIFIPLTFLAGVYGMNMPIPENKSEWSYPAFWLVCLSTVVGMLLWFRRRGWV